MNKTKVALKVTYNSARVVTAGKVMSAIDESIVGIDYPITETYSWTTSMVVNKKYINKMKKVIKEKLEKEGCEVLSIKKITI